MTCRLIPDALQATGQFGHLRPELLVQIGILAPSHVLPAEEPLDSGANPPYFVVSAVGYVVSALVPFMSSPGKLVYQPFKRSSNPRIRRPSSPSTKTSLTLEQSCPESKELTGSTNRKASR